MNNRKNTAVKEKGGKTPLPSPTKITPGVESKKEDTKGRGEGTHQLNPKQELFCQFYATEKEFFGNGVQSYIEAYNPDTSKSNWYKTACASASQLLSNINVCERINELLEDGGLNDTFVDKQLLLLITQNADYSNKLGAMKEYNKLKQRITDKMDVNITGPEIYRPSTKK